MRMPPIKITGPNAGRPRQFPIWTPLAARVGQFYRWSRHEVALNTAWLDRFPDQALRVAAGIPRKHASVGQRLGGRYCQGCGAFPEM